MSNRRAVVTGASIAGLSAAWWLRSTGWEVTLLERADAFRDGGQNVDVRGVGHEVLDRMGLTDAVRAVNTTETGTVLVDDDGEVLEELPSNGPDGATAELEVLRGDLARTVLDALPKGVDLRFGDHLVAVRRDPEGVTVTTAGGDSIAADLLVVAEGVGSTTRDLVMGDDVGRHTLGISMVFGTIPRTPDDDDRWRWLTTTGGRQVHLRPDPHGTTRAILAVARRDPLAGRPVPEVLADLREVFADVGWAAGRVLDGFAASDDVYVDDLTQIRMDTWHRGRVVLAGDAAWCVTPLGGAGATLALTSGQVLAALLSTEDDVEEALRAYEAWMRPLVDDVQQLPPGFQHVAFPQTRAGLAVRRAADSLVLSTPLRAVAARMTRVAQARQDLPEVRGTSSGG